MTKATDNNEREHCFKCGMSFRVGDPVGAGPRKPEWSRCACGRLHWSVCASDGNRYGAPAKTVVCGVAA